MLRDFEVSVFHLILRVCKRFVAGHLIRFDGIIAIRICEFFGVSFMSTKASITAGERHHLYFQEYLDTEPQNVFFELIRPREYSIVKETTRDAGIVRLCLSES
jgi:hypothetical protein